MAVHEQALLALDRDDKPRPTPESSRGSTMEAAEQRVERPSVSSDLGLNREEILAGRPFYLRAGMSVSTGMSTCTSTSVSESARARVGREASVCVSDARCRAVARAAPPLASLRQAVACSSREERPRCPHPNALTFGLASHTPRRGGQGIDIDTSYLWGYSVVGGWAGAWVGRGALGVPVRSGTGTAHSIPHTHSTGAGGEAYLCARRL